MPWEWFVVQITFFRLLAVGVLAWPLDPTARAQAADEPRSCAESNPAATIAACTKLLSQSGSSEAQLILSLLERGSAYAEAGDCGKGNVDFSSVIEIAPAASYAYVRRGYCHLMASAFDPAIADLSQAISLDPEQRDTYNQRATAWRAKGDAMRALTDMAAAIGQARKITSQSPEDLMYRALGHLWRYDYDSALLLLDNVLTIAPSSWDALQQRADARTKTGKLDLALADYDKVIEKKPESSDAYLGRAEVYQLRGDKVAAARDVDRVLALVPKPANAFEYNIRAWANCLAGRFAEGLPDAEEALKRLPNDPSLLHTRARLLEGAGRVDDAVADYRLALRLDPDNPEVRHELTRLGVLSSPQGKGKR